MACKPSGVGSIVWMLFILNFMTTAFAQGERPSLNLDVQGSVTTTNGDAQTTALSSAIATIYPSYSAKVVYTRASSSLVKIIYSSSPVSSSVVGVATKTLSSFAGPIVVSTDTSSASKGVPESNHHDHTNSDGHSNYYLIFIAPVVILAGVVVFLVFRQRRRAALRRQYAGATALTEHLGGPPTGAGWLSKWKPERAMSKVEGLNDQGEAPPPYGSKVQGETDHSGVSMPPRAFSRDGTGAKLPEYSETHMHDSGS